MTTNDFRSAEDLQDQHIVEGLLAETGMDHPTASGLLKPALMDVRSIAHGPQPTPHGEFAALLASLDAGSTAAHGSGTVSSLEAHRRKRHPRLVIAATALSLTLGAGAAAAAVNPDFRDNVQKTVTALVGPLTPAPNERPPGTPAPVDAPAPAQPTLPGKTVPSGPPAAPPATSDPQPDETVPVPQTKPGLNNSLPTEHPAPPPPPAPIVPGG